MLSEGILLVSSPRCDLIGASERILLGGLGGDERLLGPQQSHQVSAGAVPTEVLF